VQLIVAMALATVTSHALDLTVPGLAGVYGSSENVSIVGLQGQSYPTFVYPGSGYINLLSSPLFSLNSHTSFDELGFLLGEYEVRALAGSSSAGMQVWVNGVEIFPSDRCIHFVNSQHNVTFLAFPRSYRLSFRTNLFGLEITNGDNIFNFKVGLLDDTLLLDNAILTNVDGNSFAGSSAVSVYRPTPIHGFIGQTWKNVIYTGSLPYEGQVSDYLTSAVFDPQFAFSQFNA